MSTQALDENHADTGFNVRLGFGRKPALLMIDLVQAYFVEGSPLYHPLFAPSLDSSLRLKAAAHAAGIPVALTRVEVQQGGIFAVRNLGEEDYRRAVASIGPNVLFPYARAQIANLVTQGGFPQLLLPPVNFELLYARSRAEAAEAQTQAAQQPLTS